MNTIGLRPLPLLAIVMLLVASACTGATPTPTPVAPGPDPWAATASGHRGMDGQQVDYACPPGGEPHTVWGTDVYTDDSSVCTAAVHVGLITLVDGGDVTIELLPGQDSYEGSERNGITTSDYGSWGGSYVIVDPGT